MNTIEITEEFSAWFRRLKDRRARAIILNRIENARLGNFGDIEPVGEGVSEMRIHYGPGYRLYLTRVGSVVYVILCGGDKGSQRRDINRAKIMAQGFRN